VRVAWRYQRVTARGCEGRPALPIRKPLRRVKTTISQLEAENDTCVVPEVALVVIALSKLFQSESEQNQTALADGDRLAQGDVDTSANDEIKSIIA